MKKYTTADLVRTWLQQSADEGKDKGKAMFFQNDTIYSYGYHFPIARLLDAPNGESVILFTTCSYSPTTTRHISAVRQGIRGTHRWLVYCFNPKADSPNEHQNNIDVMYNGFKISVAKHDMARKPELYAREMFHYASMAKDYCKFMQITAPEWTQLPEGIEPGERLAAALKIHGVTATPEWV